MPIGIEVLYTRGLLSRRQQCHVVTVDSVEGESVEDRKRRLEERFHELTSGRYYVLYNASIISRKYV